MDELVGAAEIAERFGVGKSTVVHDWRSRHSDFPEPVATLRAGLVWSWPDVRRWGQITGRLRVYTDKDGQIHDLIAPGDTQSGTVWVKVWLVDQEERLQWIREDPSIRSAATDGMNGPNVYKVIKPRWEQMMEATLQDQLGAIDELGVEIEKEQMGKGRP